MKKYSATLKREGIRMFFTRKYKNLLKEIKTLILNLKNTVENLSIPHCDEKKEEEYRFINLDNTYLKVKNHWFWDEYDQCGWEPQTYDIYKKYLNIQTKYIDIGAWVGMTIFFAAETGVKEIYAIEANPVSYGLVAQNCKINKKTNKAKLSNVCITDKDDEEIRFGHSTSSASSIRGNEYTVKTKTLNTYLKDNNLLDDDLFIKIDIEGAEELIIKDLEELAKKPNLTIYLSFHPDCWQDKEKTTEELLNVAYGFENIRFSDNRQIDKETLKKMCLTKDKTPDWGTPFGNYFEIVLNNGN